MDPSRRQIASLERSAIFKISRKSRRKLEDHFKRSESEKYNLDSLEQNKTEDERRELWMMMSQTFRRWAIRINCFK